MSVQLGKETAIRNEFEDSDKKGSNRIPDIKSELDFGTWYHNLEDELLSASHEEYQ